ncbi:MAG TPA: amino acid adenylation domain-containing protein [Methylomirabilota bacterium]|nr:amino acid adenylation domain-containing protein [Methylomirabilota bacterium]
MAGDPARRRVAGLSGEERARLEARLLERGPAARPTIPRRNPGTALPLSLTQQRLWFLHQLAPDTHAYHIPLVARLRGVLAVEALRRALEAVVHRHEALRTSFVLEGDVPVQRVAPPAPVALPVESLEDRASPEAAAREAARCETGAPFDLARGPLIRARLFRLAADDHVLALTVHHLVSDAWSMGLLARELEAGYAAARAGRAAPLAPLPVQYGDYAVWQQGRLDTPEMAAQATYWEKRLAGAPPALALPTDRPRPAVQSFAGARVPVAIGPEVTEALRALARQEGATLYMVLLAGFQLLLARYAEQEDVLVGSPIAGRPAGELEGLIGFFANTVVLRGDLGGDPTFRELLRRTREAALGAYAHQELPFERLVETLRPARDAARNPVFQVMFALQNAPYAPLALAGLTVEPVAVADDTAKVDLTLVLGEQDGALAGRLEYCTDLFAPGTAEAMARQLGSLLAGIAADPDCPIWRLPLLTGVERHRLVVDVNQTRTAYPADRSIHALFAERVARTPAAVAVIEGERAVSYEWLYASARRLTRRLRGVGVRPGARVGISLGRSIEQVVAQLAVLMAGAAYVPLDPAHPVPRRAAMLADAGARAVIASAPGTHDLDGAAWPVVAVDRDDTARGADEPPATRGGRDPAYVMYTSGSTGAPKGVIVPHRAIARLVRNTDYVRLEPDDVIAYASNPAFDAATFEVWGALVNGARLVVMPSELMLDSRALATALEARGVTTLFLTTALFNLVARERPDAFRGLRQVLFGGEASDPQAVAEVLRAGGPRRLLHVYGPTETTTFATWHEVREVPEPATSVPIGRPLANTEVFVLDRRREPMPEGVPGELYIGGPGLAEGYLGRNDLTAERFVPHPFDPTPGARLYRTGDRVRWRPDGALEFLGRLDRQVKIRGHRIEPDEVEAALAALPEVAEAVVAVRGDTSDTRHLAAFVVPAPGAMPDAAAVRVALRAVLPEYMIPTAFVFLDALPLTGNGKVDRDRLPESALAAEPAGAHLAPRNALERTLAGIWEGLLGVPRVGIRDSFFELGGHSLLAARMMESVERAVGRRVPITTLFRVPTVEHLAQALREAVTTEPPLIALRAEGSQPPFFFLHGDFSGGGFFSRALAEAVGPEQPFYAVHPHGLVDSAVPDSIEAMAADRLAAVRAVRPHGPYLLGGHCNGGLVALEMARLLVAQGEAVPLLVLLDATAPRRTARVVAGLARLADAALRVPPAGRGERVLRWVAGERAIATRLRYYRSRLAAHGGVGPTAGLALGRAGNALAALLGGGRPVASPPPPAGPSQPRRESGTLADRYERAVRRYLPARYDGRVIVLRSQDEADLRTDLGWRSVCQHVETYAVPGDHLGAITRHVAATGARLRACLERVDRPS